MPLFRATRRALIPAVAAGLLLTAAAPAGAAEIGSAWTLDQRSSAGSSTNSADRPGPSSAAAGGSTNGSGGSGGSYADAGGSHTAAGHTARYRLFADGVSASSPVDLVVYFDGTGESGVDNPGSSYALGGSRGLVAVAAERNAITLAVASPNQSCECWHTGDTGGHADYAADLIEAQLGAYPVDDVWLVGFSSGAQEITRFLVPRHPELLRFGGGWVVLGGGGPPAGGGSAVTASAMAGVRGHWHTGTADTAVPLDASWGARAGEAWYAARGVQTSHEWPAGAGHGLDGRLGSIVAAHLDG